MAITRYANNPELLALDRLIDRAGSRVCSEVITQIAVDNHNLPIWAITLGNRNPDCPAVGFFGGVHGVERIGSQVLIAYLSNLVERLTWDNTLHDLLTQIRLVFVPIVNPGGFLRGTRANPNGVDLMRHAPIDASTDVRWPLGGQRLSRHLPWYRGSASAEPEPEAAALYKTVRERLLNHRFSIAIDCHSGFGFRDRIWFPYAGRREPLQHLAEAYALSEQFSRTYPHHSFYVMEPQSLNYTTHGDVWDYLYDEAIRTHPQNVFLPLTLEMGSWTWMKKNPRQLLDPLGLFNPMLPHRQARVLRRHVTLFDFLQQSAVSYQRWKPTGELREQLHQDALKHWFQPL